MIRRFKAFVRSRWPTLRLRTIVLAVLIFTAALPGVSAIFLRVYENTLVRQTEAELVAQGAALAAAAEAAWPGAPAPQALPPLQ
ncbi:sensor histidine kinase, partial [Caulobacter sp. 17J65-9]|nr:sensor histidine kinase [Caulobacter sp. 17J65-9]